MGADIGQRPATIKVTIMHEFLRKNEWHTWCPADNQNCWHPLLAPNFDRNIDLAPNKEHIHTMLKSAPHTFPYDKSASPDLIASPCKLLLSSASTYNKEVSPYEIC